MSASLLKLGYNGKLKAMGGRRNRSRVRKNEGEMEFHGVKGGGK